MRGGNNLKNYIIAGLIAGFVTGIVKFIFASISLNVETQFLSGLFLIPVSINTAASVEIMHGIIWGVIFSVFYALFYDYIPGKGIKKGLVYGLFIWIIVIFRTAVIGMIHGYYLWAIPWAFAGFFSIVITYGLLVGILYKKE